MNLSHQPIRFGLVALLDAQGDKDRDPQRTATYPDR